MDSAVLRYSGYRSKAISVDIIGYWLSYLTYVGISITTEC